MIDSHRSEPGHSSQPDKPNGTQPTAAASSGAVLGYAQLQQAYRAMPSNIPTAIILVAPNNKVAKQWRKEYPGVKVTTARRYYTSNVYAYPLPKDMLTKVTDLAKNSPPSHTEAVKSATQTPPSEDIDKLLEAFDHDCSYHNATKAGCSEPNINFDQAKAALTSIMQAKQIEELERLDTDPTIPPDCPKDCHIKDKDSPSMEHWHHVVHAYIKHRIKTLRNNHG